MLGRMMEEQRREEQHDKPDEPTLELGTDAGEEQDRGHDDRDQYEIITDCVRFPGGGRETAVAHDSDKDLALIELRLLIFH